MIPNCKGIQSCLALWPQLSHVGEARCQNSRIHREKWSTNAHQLLFANSVGGVPNKAASDYTGGCVCAVIMRATATTAEGQSVT